MRAPLAEFIREFIVSGTREGLADVRARGKVGGRPTVVNPDIVRAARDMLPDPDHSITLIAKLPRGEPPHPRSAEASRTNQVTPRPRTLAHPGRRPA
ncbi:hypothetical protein AQI95_43050 [Streptomyces yokosukanensis]|uniref:Resolvase/invertase-type recombinase catalytic domain-containing protein n=1 Tax=Streptomyces yokosukanensis TaxID=67386 RepID=A0A101NLZ0_9ACTN|nr:recombinase family protein [Streptomyces yokosukanensis]KUM95743.1 hypothetical protein AQI95_43050 [Streptomyces yokosukanensis]